MIILRGSTDYLKIKLGGAVATNELPVLVCYDEISPSSRDEQRTVNTSNGASYVTIASGATSSTTINVDFVNIYNKDTDNATVTVSYYDNATEYVIKVATLASGECLEYTNENGWNIK